jgi:hypothetical protein
MAPVAADIVAHGRVKDGRLFLTNRKEFNRQVAMIPPDWDLEISVERVRASRSQALNPLLLGCRREAHCGSHRLHD